MKMLLIYLTIMITTFTCGLAKDKAKYNRPIYPSELISATTKRGKLSALIKKISDNHEGIPSITITPSAQNILIPPIEANRTSLGELFKALHLYKDDITKRQLIINIQPFSIEISTVDLPGEALKKVEKPSKYKIKSYRIVLLREKVSLKKFIPIITEKYNQLWSQEAVIRYSPSDDILYIFGLPDDVNVLAQTFDQLNKTPLKKKDADRQAQPIIEKILNTLFIEHVDTKLAYHKKYIAGYRKDIMELISQVEADNATGANNIKKQIKEFKKIIKANQKAIKELTATKDKILTKKK